MIDKNDKEINEKTEEFNYLFQKWTKEKIKNKLNNLNNSVKNEMIIKKEKKKKLFNNENLKKITASSKYSNKSKANSIKTNNVNKNKFKNKKVLYDKFDNSKNDWFSLKDTIKSNAMTSSSTYKNKGMIRTNNLYKNSIYRENKKLINKREHLNYKIKKEMKECTFKPSIKKYKQTHKNKPVIKVEEIPVKLPPKPIQKSNLINELRNKQINIENLFTSINNNFNNKIKYNNKEARKKLKTLDFI